MSKRTIALKAPGVRNEATASAAVTPGELLEFGGSNDLRAHSSAGGDAMPMVAVENDVVGDDTDTDYGSGDQVQYDVPHTGAEYYMWLASGENVSKGDFLESDGAGNLQKVGTASSSAAHVAVVGQALEALDLSGATTGRARIKVRIR